MLKSVTSTLRYFRDGYLIHRSRLFDTDWYLKTYPDVAASCVNPVLHYSRTGWLEGRDPGPKFSTLDYLSDNDDVRNSGCNPLLHYIRNGELERRPIRAHRASKAVPSTSTNGVPSLQTPGFPHVEPVSFSGFAERLDNRPTVLVCAHSSGHQLFGGERSFLDVISALNQLAINCIVTLPSHNNSAYVEAIRAKCLRLYSLPYRQWREAIGEDPAMVAAFESIIVEHHIECVHANTIMLREPLTAARRQGVVCVVHAREIITLDEPLSNAIGLSPTEIVDRVLQRADVLIANSRATAKCFSAARSLFCVMNTVDVDELDMDNSVDPRSIRFGIISSNLPKKGILDFVEVARRCQHEVSNARFLVIGPENDLLRDLRKEGLPSNLRILGYRASPKLAMGEVNVVMNLSSFAESFGRSVAEAMAAKRPVIAYEWGALPEMIQHGETGYAVPYRDVAAVVESVKDLCSHPDKIEEKGRLGRQRIVELCSKRAYVRSMGLAYHSIFPAARIDERVRSTKNESYPRRLCDVRLLRACRSTTVIITAFNAFAELKRCVLSVLEHTRLDQSTSLLIVDDASTDQNVHTWLETLNRIPGIRIVRNPSNLGYTKTVNLAIRESEPNDVVILNSDARVTERWLNALRITAYSTPRVGTVTALSDNAGAFSMPVPGQANPKPDGLSDEDYARAVRHSCATQLGPELPTGNGFCMFIRRELLNEIGVFDEAAFPRGYGEENDFCMRAIRSGWLNVMGPGAFAYHARGASFGPVRQQLIQVGVNTVTRRHPDYAERVRAAFSHVSMLNLQRSIARGLSSLDEVLPRRNLICCSEQLHGMRFAGPHDRVMVAKGEDLVAYATHGEIGAPVRRFSLQLQGSVIEQELAEWLISEGIDTLVLMSDANAPTILTSVANLLGISELQTLAGCS